MAQGESPRNPLAFASVLCPGRCLASQPIHLGSEVEQYPSDGVPCTPRKEAQGLPSSSGFLSQVPVPAVSLVAAARGAFDRS